MERRKLGNSLLWLFTLAIVAGFISAYSVSAQSKMILKSEPSEGYSFEHPSDLNSTRSEGGHALVDQKQTMLILVKSHNNRDFEQFAASANLEADGLTLVGSPQQIQGGTSFRTSKNTPQGMAIVDTFVVFSPFGGGAIVVALSDVQNAEASFKAGYNVAMSLKFKKAEVSAKADQVRNVLGGKHLLYLYTGSGYSERTDIYLCKSGTAYRSSDLGGFTPGNVDGPSAAAYSRNQGTWRISPDGNTLIIVMNNGATSQYKITPRQAGNEIALNGNRYFVKEHNVCR